MTIVAGTLLYGKETADCMDSWLFAESVSDPLHLYSPSQAEHHVWAQTWLCASTLWQDCPGQRPPLPWSSSCFCAPACGLNVFCLSDLFTFWLWPLPLCNLDYNKDNRLITHISSSKSELDDASRPIPGWSCHVFCIIYHFLVQRHPTNVEMNCLNLLKTINKLRKGYAFRCQ